MAEKRTKLYLELQMEELKATYGVSEEEKAASEEEKKKNDARNAEIAKMYEDAAEYEADLALFESELAVVNANRLEDIADALSAAFCDEERDYHAEIQTILNAGWAHFVAEGTHPQEQLEIVKNATIKDVVERLCTVYPAQKESFEADIRKLLVKRWENLIAIKKEHIKQELAEIKTTGLKPKYVKRVYEQFHGLTK
jgi:hypothetical protein